MNTTTSHPTPENPPELLTAFTPEGEFIKIEERKRLFAEIREYSERTGDAPFALEVVLLMLCNSAGELHVVRRGNKPENPFLWDKTVGGHVSAGETFASALCRETMEEIGVEVILTDLMSYPMDVKRLDTRHQAVVRPIDFSPWLRSVRRDQNGKEWVKRHRCMIYAGRYDGELQFKDNEAMETQLWAQDALLTVIQRHPEDFTPDLESMLQKYSSFLW